MTASVPASLERAVQNQGYSKKVEKAITQTVYMGLGMSRYLLHNGYEACSAHGRFLEDLHAELLWHTLSGLLVD